MKFYDSKTGERIPDEIIKKAFAGEIKLDNVNIANRNMTNNVQPLKEEHPAPEVLHVSEDTKKAQKKPEFEFFKMVNDHADRVRAGFEKPYEPVSNKPEITKEDAKTRMYYKALNASIVISPADKSKLPKRDRNRKKAISKTIISLFLVLLIAICGYVVAKRIANKIDQNQAISDTKESIASIMSTANDSTITSIVKHNTHPTNDHQQYWYDNYAIAEDIINLIPDAAFDAALYTVYLDMGSNVSNEYIDNFGRVISSCGRLASPSDNPIAYARTSDCHGFEDFARKNGYVDENGEPSMEAYNAFGLSAAKDYQKYGKMAVNNNMSEEKPQFGGRQ